MKKLWLQKNIDLSVIFMPMAPSGQVVVYSFRTIIIGFMFISQEQVFAAPATSCQVYPLEYAYHSNSVTRTEVASANCMSYPASLQPPGIHAEDYIHCNGTQLKLTDSDFGSEQYSSSKYYVWPSGTRISQLLFIFPIRVNLTTITLHYYSDNIRGLPRLRFFAVPHNFHIWDAPIAGYSFVEITSIAPSEEPAGRRNVSIHINLVTKKVLMMMLSSNFSFALSEVVFFMCLNPVTTEGVSTLETTIPIQHLSTTLEQYGETSATAVTESSTTVTGVGQPSQPTHSVIETFDHAVEERLTSVREVIAWTLAAVSTVLCVGSLTVNIIMLWIYKNRQSKDNSVETAMCEMEGNPCYEVSNMKKIADTVKQN